MCALVAERANRWQHFEYVNRIIAIVFLVACVLSEDEIGLVGSAMLKPGRRPQVETAVAALKVQQTAYQEQMKKVRDANDAALADLRKGSERMVEEFAKAYAQAVGRFAA